MTTYVRYTRESEVNVTKEIVVLELKNLKNTNNHRIESILKELYPDDDFGFYEVIDKEEIGNEQVRTVDVDLM